MYNSRSGENYMAIINNIYILSGVAIIIAAITGILLLNNQKIKDKLTKLKNIVQEVIDLYTNPQDRVLLFIGLVILAVVSFIFKNIITSLLSFILVIIIPSLINDIINTNKRKKMLFELSMAIRVYVKQFEITKNYRKSLLNTGKSTKGDVSNYIKEAYADLTSGDTLDEVTKRLGNKLGGYHGQMFAKYIEASKRRGSQIIPLMYSLVSSVVLEQEKETFKQSEVSSDNMVNLILLLLPIAEYFYLKPIIPQVEQLMFHSEFGILLFTAWLVNIILWFISNKLIND